MVGTSRDPLNGMHLNKDSAYRGLSEFWRRKITFKLSEQVTLTQVSSELELYDEAFYNLHKGVLKYANN